MNLSQIYTECGRLLNDPNNSRWPTATLLDRINDAQKVIQGYTKAVKTSESVSISEGNSQAALNARTMDVIRVKIQRPGGDQFPLDGTTYEEMDFYYPNWRNLGNGEPKTWIYDATQQILVLIPKPDANSAAVTTPLSITSVWTPTDLASPSEIPFDSNNQMVPYHDSIVHYVVAKCWQDDATPEALSKSKFHMSGSLSKPGEFENEIMRILGEFDNPRVPTHIKFQPTGGRLGSAWMPSKSNPLA
jgi:hypothetical protein